MLCCSERGEEPDSDGPERSGRSVLQAEAHPVGQLGVRQQYARIEAEDEDDQIDVESGLERDLHIVRSASATATVTA